MKRRVLLSGAVALITVAAAAVATAAGAAVPPTPSGWSLVWSDDFTGARQHPAVVRQLDHRHRHQLPRRPGQLGHRRDPDLHQQHRATSASTAPATCGSRRSATAPATGPRPASRPAAPTSRPPAGGVLRIEGRIQMPNVTGAAALGYWPAFWALGAPYRGNYWNWPRHRRVRHHGERQRHQLRLGRAALRRRPGRAVQRVQRHRRQPGLPRLDAASRAFHTYRFEWDRSVSPNQLRWYVDGQQYHTVSQSQVGEPHLDQHDQPRRLLHPAQRRDGRRASPTASPASARPTAATVSGRPMVVDYVAVCSRGGGTTPPTDAAAAARRRAAA